MRSAARWCICVAITMVGLTVPGRDPFAQVNGVHVLIEPWGGFANYAKNVNLDDSGVFGGRVGLMLHRYVGIEGHYGFLKTDSFEGPLPWRTTGSLPVKDVDVKHYGVDLALNLRPSAWFNPYVLGGWQEGKLEPPGGPESFENGFEFGAGVKLRPASRVAIRVEFRDGLWKFPSPPAPVPPGKDAVDNQFYTAGIEFALGGSTGPPPDADRDGVRDSKDKCPDTPMGCRVDENGCPIDSDGDGVCDGVDQCADTPRGTAVDARGCPTDSDNDGVTDDRDKCPNTPAGIKVDKDGCPIEVIERETELLNTGMIRLSDIHFETAKWDIMPDDEPRLATVGEVLLRWPQLRIEIGGHCDWRGSRAYNHDLSHKRATAVLEWLLAHYPGLNREQFTVKGYGEDKPIATNKTDTGMAKNRRVEFVVLNREVLKKEVEKRRLLRQGEGAPSDTTR